MTTTDESKNKWGMSPAASFLVLVFALSIARFLSQQEAPCKSDLPVWNNTIAPCEVFSESYQEARDKFKAAAKDAGATQHSLLVHGSNYTMDIAVLTGSSTDHVVFHSSGVHGVEGYAGSAIQIAFLKEAASKDIKPSATIVLIHAVNPYGMAHFRRVNEENVDLNRNAMTDFTVAFERDPNIAHYDDFTTNFNPLFAPTRFFAYVGVVVNVFRGIYENGLLKLKKAMVSGQYHNAKGIFYGGQSLQFSYVVLTQFVQNFFKDRATWPSKVTWIDVHTGLGKYGHDTLFFSSVSDEQFRAGSRAFKGGSVTALGRNQNDVTAGYELTIGAINDLMEAQFQSLFQDNNDKKKKVDTMVISQEFGTKSNVYVARALILENMAYNFLEAVPEWVQEIFKSAFYPRTSKWRRLVLTRGLIVFHQGIERNE